MELANLQDTLEHIHILSYDHPSTNDMIRILNEDFQGTKITIPIKEHGEVKNIYLLRRLAIISTLYQNPKLIDSLGFPISPLESELIVDKDRSPDGKITVSGSLLKDFWEDLGLIIYSTNGDNAQEASYLLEDIKKNRFNLGIEESDLEKPLLVVNAGLNKDEKMRYGVKPCMLPGLTKVYVPRILQQPGDTFYFQCGLDQGLPFPEEVIKEEDTTSRVLALPNSDEKNGLKTLSRINYGGIYTNCENLYFSDDKSTAANGRIFFNQTRRR